MIPESERTALEEKAVNIIEESLVPQEDKDLLLERVPYVADNILTTFIEACEENPFWIDGMVDNFKRKLDARGDMKKLREIIEEERDEVMALKLGV